MGSISFSSLDAAILYSIPQPGATLSKAVRYYCFINRDAPPAAAALAECVAKSSSAGVLRVSSAGLITVDPGWYEYIHRADGSASNEIDSMLDFEERLTAKVWPAVAPSDVTLGDDDYPSAVDSIGGV